VPGRERKKLPKLASRVNLARRVRRFRGAVLHESVKPLAVLDEAVAFPRNPFDRGGVVQQRVLVGSQRLDLGPALFQPQLLRRLIPADAPQLEVAVVPSEKREVERAREEYQAEAEAQLQKASLPR